MTTNCLQSLHYRHRHHHRHTPPLVRPPPPPPTLTLSPKPNYTNPNISISSNLKTFSLSSSATSPSSQLSFDNLERLLSANDFQEADNETRRLLIALAGEAAVKRGYVFFSEVQFIPASDLKIIDSMWKDASNSKFGYSVQKKIWLKSGKDFTKFFIKVGWMKKLDTEMLQYNYRAFPEEFMWELNDETPEGHLPLTNALRGTQLLNCILTHPAFVEENEEEIEEENEGRERESKVPVVGKGLFKTNYSF